MNLSSVPQSVKSTYPEFGRSGGGVANLSDPVLMAEEQGDIHKFVVSAANSYLRSPSVNSPRGSPVHYQNADS